MPKIDKPVTDDPKILQRRKLMRNMMMGGAALVGASAVGAPAMGAPAALAGTLSSRTSGLPVWNVLDFGAKGDWKSDNTQAFQTAMDVACNAGGGIVYAPAGKYLFKGNLVMPRSVTLQGIYQGPPLHFAVSLAEEQADVQYDPLNNALFNPQGTFLIPTAGAGSETAPPFLDMTQPDTCLRGLSIMYPDQGPIQGSPKPYPWSIFLGNYGAPGSRIPDYAIDGQGDYGEFGQNPTIENIELIFSYNGILVETEARPYIRNVQGTVFRRGIYVNVVEDIGRLENIHWHNSNGNDDSFSQANLEAFIFGRMDWGYMLNCFVFTSNIGYHFVDPMSNVLIMQCGADSAGTAIQVDNCIGDWGISWVGGQFDGNINVSSSNGGPVRFSHCSFLGGGVNLAGSGRVSFTNCHFMGGVSATQCPVMINSCDLGGNSINVDSSVPVLTAVGNQGLAGISGTPGDLQAFANSSN